MKHLTVPDPLIVENQIKLISKTNAVRFIKPRFFKVNVDNIAIEQGDIPDKKSWMGTPVFDTFIFNGGFSYVDSKGVIVNVVASYMLDSCLITVNQTKNIIKTQIAGGNGTVKEYIGDGDYEIKIQGMIVGKYANIPPPITEKIRIAEILKAPMALPISCNFLDMFNINSVVIEDFEFSQIEGTRNAIGVSISCISDEPFEIQYSDASAKYTGTSVLSFR